MKVQTLIKAINHINDDIKGQAKYPTYFPLSWYKRLGKVVWQEEYRINAKFDIIFVDLDRKSMKRLNENGELEELE